MEVCFGKNETRHRSEGLTKRGGRKGQSELCQHCEIGNHPRPLLHILSLVTPLFLCLALCWWLCDRFSVGTWIYLIGFFFGIGGGAVTAWKFGQSVLRHQKRSETEPDGKKKKKRVSFNRHI